MSSAKTFRRGRSHRRRTILLIIAAVGIAAILLGVWGLSRRAKNPDPGTPDNPSAPGATTAPTATTTTLPVLSEETVTQLDTTLTARNILLYDATHDRVLYAKGASEVCYPASLTKLMTAAVAAKYATEEPFTIGREVYLKDPQASSANLKLGMTLTLPQLLEALLLPSGGDAAYTLAVTTILRMYPEEELSNFEAAMRFCDLMNEELAAMGATNTFFVNPDGIYHTNHVTTAADMLRVMQFALSFEDVRTAMSLPSVSFTTEDGKQLTYINTNRLLNRNTAYYYPYATGGKTGYTDEAGYCLGSVAEKDGVTLIALVFGCAEEAARFTESAALFDAGFALTTT